MSLMDVFGGNPPVASNKPISERFSGKNRASRKEVEKYARWANETQQSIKMARSNTERNWYLNLCFYFGRQYVAYRQSTGAILGTTGALYVPPAPYYRSRPVINRIRPIIRKEVAKLTAQKPSAYVIPASSDDHDLFAAQAGEQIWESVYRGHKLKSIIRRAVWWNQVCGNAYIKAYWDPNKEDKDSNLQGDFCFAHETPFHVFVPDFREEELESQPYLIHAQLRSKDWVDVNFPGLDLRSSSAKAEEILEPTWLNLIGAAGVKGQDSIMVLECWIKPGANPNFPNGCMFTVIGDNIVQSFEGWPYQHGLYPFAKLSHIPSGKFYADSTIVDLISLQKEYNRTRGQIIESKNSMAKHKLLAERGSVIASQITSEPGQVIFYEPGLNPPTPLKLEPMPAYVTQELERILMDMNDISGQHEISQGQTPPGVTAATAINYLQEQDDTMIAATFESLEEAIEKTAFLTLSYAQQYWDVDRVIKIVGTDQSFDAMSFSGSDLRGNTDIRIEAGSSLPTSKAAKQAFVMDLMKMNFITPDKGLEVLEMGGIAKIYEAVQQDVRQAQRENLKMAAFNQQIAMQFQQQQQIDPATGQPIPQPLPVAVNTWDNHAAHIATHNKYRKSQGFENLDDASKQLFESHVQMHQAAMFQDMMSQPPMMQAPEDDMPMQPPVAQGDLNYGSNT